MKAWIIFLILLLCGSTEAAFANGLHAPSETESADQIASPRPDSHAPLGVMGDHAHRAGELMFSYRFMGMAMDELRDGTTPISTEEALHDYAMVPTTMQRQMHMFGAMLAPHDRVTLMAMISYLENSMEMEGAHLHGSGGHDHPVGHLSMATGGLGDIRLSALIPLLNTSNADLLLNTGVSIPTGAIDLRGTHGGDELTTLRYPMQLGSGSFELRPGLTFATTHGSWSYGAQARSTIPLNKNSRDYKLGFTIGSTLWGHVDSTTGLAFRSAVHSKIGAILQHSHREKRWNPMNTDTVIPMVATLHRPKPHNPTTCLRRWIQIFVAGRVGVCQQV